MHIQCLGEADSVSDRNVITETRVGIRTSSVSHACRMRDNAQLKWCRRNAPLPPKRFPWAAFCVLPCVSGF